MTDLYEEQQQFLKEELLQMLENGLKKDVSQEMRTRLEEMRTALETEQYEAQMEKLHEEYQTEKKIKKPTSKRQSFREIFSEKIMSLVDCVYAIRSDTERPKKKYKSEDKLKTRVEELVDKFYPQTKRQLIPQLVEATVRVELLTQEVDELKAAHKFLTYHYFRDLLKRREAVNNQKTGKDKIFSDNNQCMQECLDEVLNAGSADKEITKLVYLRFCRLVKKKFPNPPFLQKQRLNREEKKQDLKTQEANREALQRNEWAPTTLRNFFENSLKVKIADLS
jgi:hypothetical protein